MPAQKVYDFLVDVVNIDDDQLFHAYHPAKQVLIVAHEITGALVKYIDVLATHDTVDDAELIEAIEKVFDRYVVPIRVSNNALIERFIESQVRAQIPALVAVLASSVQEIKQRGA